MTDRNARTWPQCTFYERKETGGKIIFQSLAISSWGGGSSLRLEEPPSIGDVILFNTSGYRVIRRQWTHPEYGSMAWPHESPVPVGGPLLTLIVEAAEGVFSDEGSVIPDEPSMENAVHEAWDGLRRAWATAEALQFHEMWNGALEAAEGVLRGKAKELSTHANRDLRRDLEELAQEWHTAADKVAKLKKKG